MNSLYCSHCGAKVTYSFEKPKFCSNCGKEIGNTSCAATPEVKQDISRVPSLSRLEYDVSFGPATQVTVGSLIQEQLKNAPTESEREVFERPPVSQEEQNKTDQEVLQESVDLCKPRLHPDEIGDP